MIPVYTLLVEDDPADKVLIERCLQQARRLQFGVEWVRDRPDAEQLLEIKQFDLILLDLTLPSSHGVDTVYAIVRKAPNTPVVVLSGKDDLDIAIVSVRAGAQAYLRKNNLSPDLVELEIFSALERARNEHNSKQLYMQSRERLSSDNFVSSVSGLAVLEPHLRRIEEYLAQEQTYLQTNSEHYWDGVQRIRQACEPMLALRELRSILNLNKKQAKQRTKKISDRALKAVQSAQGGSVSPRSIHEAEARVLSALQYDDEEDE